MPREPSERIDPRAIDLWGIHGLFQSVVTGGLGLMAAWTIVGAVDASWLWIAAVPAVVLVYAPLTVFVFPRIRWRMWRYELEDEALHLQRGLFTIRRTLVPLVRVQHVDTVQGPAAKLFQLASVTVSTAASTHEIPALTEDVADALRDRISSRAKEAREPD